MTLLGCELLRYSCQWYASRRCRVLCANVTVTTRVTHVYAQRVTLCTSRGILCSTPTRNCSHEMPRCQKTISECTLSNIYKPTTKLNIKYGFPILMVSWDYIKNIVFVLYFLNVVVIILSICMLCAAIKLSKNITGFMNMITKHDGTALSACLCIAGTLSLIISSLLIWILFKSCKTSKNKLVNKLLFTFIIICLGVGVIVILLGIFAQIQELTLDKRSHDGISTAMLQYKDDCSLKRKIDTLQLVLQCCGSNSYEEWFNIEWYESPLDDCDVSIRKDDTPFSCCSMHSPFPCIHYDIMSIGSSYLYAPESNISISEYGCFPILSVYTKLLFWRTGACLFVLGPLLLVIVVLARFVQSAHMEFYKFERNCHWHTCWLFGLYCGKKRKTPPKLPPFP